MKKTLFILCCFMLSACSWQEYFAVFNYSERPVTVSYSLEPESKGFSLFDEIPMVYTCSENRNILWDKTIAVKDQHESRHIIKITLKPNEVLVFGSLSNDNYEKHTQVFINDRHFNLLTIQIGDRLIEKDEFDNWFKKSGGIIAYLVKD